MRGPISLDTLVVTGLALGRQQDGFAAISQRFRSDITGYIVATRFSWPWA